MKSSRLIIITALLIFTSNCFAQQNSTWNKWNRLIGSWKGEGNGEPGQGEGTFSFTQDLDKKIIIRKSHSEYPATKDKPKIVHDDLMVVYLDFKGNPSKAIYFDNEGHTINYSITYQENKIILISDKVPNVPVFRLTYTQPDTTSIDTKFEMAQDGATFTTYVEGKSKKIQ